MLANLPTDRPLLFPSGQFVRQPLRLHPIIGAAFLLFAMIAASPLAHAAPNMFEARVPVDATAASAAKARDEALASGQREAFYDILKRLTPRQYHASLPNLDTGTIATYARDFSVSDEKTSSVRYLATLDVRFKQDDVRSLLDEFGIPFAETPSRPALILPVLTRGTTSLLWRAPNPWMTAWSKAKLPTLPVPMLVPVGDIEDVGNITAEQALINDTDGLAAVARRYDAGVTIVAHADIAAIGAPNIDMTLTRFDIGLGSETFRTTVQAHSGETVDSVLARAVPAAIEAIEERWKVENLMHYDKGGILAVTIPIHSLRHWIDIRSQLSKIPVVERTDLVLLSRDEARLNIHYIGDANQLNRALAQFGLKLTEQQGVWTLFTPETARNTDTNNATDSGDDQP